MKRIFIILLIGIMMSSVAFAQRFQTSVIEDDVQKEKKVGSDNSCGGETRPMRMTGFINYPPFGWVEKKVEFLTERYINHGLALDLFEKVAKDVGLYTKNVGMTSYADAQKAVRWGQADVLLGTYYESNPIGFETIYPAYINNPFVIVSLKGKLPADITNFQELKGKKGVVRREEMIWPLLYQTFPKDIPVEQVSGARTAFKKLINHEADFMITSMYAAEAEMRRFKVKSGMDVTQTVLKNPNIFFVFTKSGDCIVKNKDRFEARLKEVVADQDYIRSLISAQILAWEDYFKDEPSLFLEDGMKMNDEIVEEVSAQDLAEEKEMQNADSVDPEALIKKQMEKMKIAH